MQLKLSDISPGDIIEHESWGCNHGGLQERLTRRKGKVIQVTDNVITLQGKNYPETLLVNDLLSGRAKILKVKMRGEEDMVKYDWDTLWPQVQELQAEGKTIVAIAEEMNINLYALKSKLYRERQEEKQTPPPKPEQAANQEPEREKVESATQSVAQEEPEITVKDVLMCETAQREQGFGPEDDEPIPYQVAEDATLDGMKVIWIENVLTHCTQAKTQLQYIQAIMDLRV